MQKNNEKISISGEKLIDALQEIEIILISLHKIGSYHELLNAEEYSQLTSDFIDAWSVTDRLAKVRMILSENFDRSLGDDDMDDLERSMSDIVVWSYKN